MLCLVAALGWGSAGYASIINFTYTSDYTNFQCYVNYDYGNSVANIDGDQYASPGHMSGYFYTDSAEDPKATKSYQILNESGFTWAGYNVNVYMDRAFSISNAFATLPADWTVAVTQPVYNGATPSYFGLNEYVGYVKFMAGTLVPDGNQLNFQYDVGFGGATTYRFADELIPVEAVPEPGVAPLLAGAAMLLFGVRWAVRRSARTH